MTRHERISATALLTVLVALLLVGLVSGTLISHALQVLPYSWPAWLLYFGLTGASLQ